MRIDGGGDAGLCRSVEPALGHLPRFIAIIEPPPDPHEIVGIKQHHANPAAVKFVVGHPDPLPRSMREGKMPAPIS